MVSRKRLIIDEIILDIDAKVFSSRTILEILNAKKVSINQSCGGFGTCGTCRFEIISGETALKKKSDYEVEQSTELKLLDNQRLSCQSELNWENDTVLQLKILGEII